MSFKVKFSAMEKERIVNQYLDGKLGFREAARLYQLNQGTLNNWIRLYQTLGVSGLEAGSTWTSYPIEVKHHAIEDYLSHSLTVPDILKKYGIRSSTQLRRWLMKYNGHKELKSSKTGGNIMTKGRTTTFEERVEIVKYCIEHNLNYNETAIKFSASYQQVRNWTAKYEISGVESLQDRRGKRKNSEQMTELEKVKAENKLLEAQNRKMKMEIDFLKKLEEIERRRY